MIRLFRPHELTQSVGDDKLLYMTYKKLPQIAKPKMTRILVADGLLGLSVISSNLTDTVTCLVENNAVIGENKNVNIPDEIIDLPAVTEKDKEFVEFAVKNKLDFIAGSFIRKAQDIKVSSIIIYSVSNLQ